jgi:putative spermidine/putrescine transport system permease protein
MAAQGVSFPHLRIGKDATAFLLVAPGVLFLLYWFIIPIGSFLTQSFDNRALQAQLQTTSEALRGWDGRELPGGEAFSALATDLKRATEEGSAALLGARLNHSLAGFRPLVRRTASRLPEVAQAGWREELVGIDKRWGEIKYWQVISHESGPITWQYGLAALDLQRGVDGSVERVPEPQRIFVGLFVQTVIISTMVTLLCILVGLPVAYMLAHGSDKVRGILIIFVLLPFWTSLLVRSAGWIVVLQDQGMLNYLLSFVGFGERAISLLYSRAAVYIAMTHVLLPFMILPIFSVMRGISDTHLKAAASLGAPPMLAFRKVYLPQVLPGIVAGATLVFVSALGYYITPMLVGGPRDQMISYFIAYYTNVSVNWGMAGTLSLVLLLSVVIVYAVIGKLVGFNRMRMQ